MANKLLETYSKRLAVSESVFKKEHGNDTLTEQKKVTIARVLANTSAYLNEAFSQSVGTQRADMGTFKKFCLDLTTVALPNLIANDLVIVKPMTSMTGFIQYLQFTAGTTKGGVTQGDVFNDPFKLGAMTDSRIDYTSAAVTEGLTAGTGNTLVWTPFVHNVFEINNVKYDAKVVGTNGTVTGVYIKDADRKLYTNSTYTTEYTATAGDKVAYKYDNIVVPQDSDIPLVNAKMTGIALQATARRIAIYYSQMAAFQAKTETGTDLGQVLATQACAELSYEIDTEVVKLLDENAGAEGSVPANLTFNKTVPVGVSKAEHYEGFAEIIEVASQVIYDRTQKHAANYMVIASNIKPILSLMRGWKAASTGKINGPYFAGTLNGIKVYVSPAIKAGRFFLGFNGDDLITSAAIYAPYMAVVPTQLLGFADGAMSQGFSTLYDLKMLNANLLVAGKVVEANQTIYIDSEE